MQATDATAAMSAMREKHAALVEQQQVEAGRALAAQAAEHAETMAAAVRSVMGDGVRDGGRQRAKMVGGSVQNGGRERAR